MSEGYYQLGLLLVVLFKPVGKQIFMENNQYIVVTVNI